MQARLDAVIEAALGSRIVGCVVLVNRGGKPVYARAAGLADREAGRSMAVDAIFRLASVTKPIVAAAALRMVDLGLLGLDDPVSKYLPYFRPRMADGSTPEILIRHLLSHTSGLGYEGTGFYSRGLSGPLLDFGENIRRMGQEVLLFAPGQAGNTACRSMCWAEFWRRSMDRIWRGFWRTMSRGPWAWWTRCLASALRRGWRSLIVTGGHRSAWRAS
jgi:CubicO group peptidase (beta-lactamase class C family)